MSGLLPSYYGQPNIHLITVNGSACRTDSGRIAEVCRVFGIALVLSARELRADIFDVLHRPQQSVNFVDY